MESYGSYAVSNGAAASEVVDGEYDIGDYGSEGGD